MKLIGLNRKEKLELLENIEEFLEPFTAFLTVIVILTEAAKLLADALKKFPTADLPVSKSLEHMARVFDVPLQLFHLVYALCVASYFIGRHYLLRQRSAMHVLVRLDDRHWNNWKKRLIFAASVSHESVYTRFASADDLDILVRMNHEAFRNTAFEVEEESLRERNVSYLLKNPRLFQIVLDPQGSGEIIGYTCLLPLSKNGSRLYRDSILSDSSLPCELLTAPGESPSSVLLFAIALRPEFQFGAAKGNRRNEIHLLRGLRHLPGSVCRFSVGSSPAPRPDRRTLPRTAHARSRLYSAS